MTGAPGTLGMLLPDDGPQDYEWHELDGWFAARGIRPAPQVQVAASACDGKHADAALRRTGSLDVLTPPARALVDGGPTSIPGAGRLFARGDG